jgi:hypothetical protein
MAHSELVEKALQSYHAEIDRLDRENRSNFNRWRAELKDMTFRSRMD